MRGSRLFSSLFAAALVALPALGFGQEAPERLMFLLRLIDQSPTAAQLVEAGAGEAGEVLIAIAKDPEVARYPRMRAAGSLGLFPSPATEAALAALVRGGDDLEVRIQALAALTHLQQARALPLLEGLVAHREVELRAAAVRNLARLEHPRVRSLLEARVQAEPEAWVRRLAERRLAERSSSRR